MENAPEQLKPARGSPRRRENEPRDPRVSRQPSKIILVGALVVKVILGASWVSFFHFQEIIQIPFQG
jgi:hypothetical protein